MDFQAAGLRPRRSPGQQVILLIEPKVKRAAALWIILGLAEVLKLAANLFGPSAARVGKKREVRLRLSDHVPAGRIDLHGITLLQRGSGVKLSRRTPMNRTCPEHK